MPELRAEDSDFKPLFDGKSLNGWIGDPDLWRVENGQIIGSTDNQEILHNSFLATQKSFKNFVLRVKFKLRNGKSGIQLRSELHDGYRVTGYQADIAADQNLGNLYEEGGRGILAKTNARDILHLNANDWNEYVITASDSNIQQQLNRLTVDYDERQSSGAAQGCIALQLHAGPRMEIHFKDIAIRELGSECRSVPIR